MVATRRSLGGQATPVPSSSPPAAPSSQLTKAQQAALKKLDIAGTDALKGDAKAAQAARDQVQTYHYRGAVYAADANTPSAWLENQPKRYLKRSRDDSAGVESRGEDSIAVGEEEDEKEEEDGDDTPARPAKRRRSMPSSRGKPRAGRGGSRSSLPMKRKAEQVDPLRDNTTTTTTTATPAKKSPIPNQKIMDEEIGRLKQKAKKNNYNVEQLDRKDIMASARSHLIKLARDQKKLRSLMLEWNLAKELMEVKKRDAGVKLLEQVEAEVEDAPAKTNYQPTIELGQSDSDSDEIDNQWQREQEQNRMDQQTRPEPEIPETSPAAQELQTSTDLQQLDFTSTSPATQQRKESSPANDQAKITLNPTSNHPVPTTESLSEAATTAGASRPHTPTPATSVRALPPPPFVRATPPTHAAAHHRTPSSTTSSARASTSKEPSITPFSHLPPDAILPTTAADGNPLRWTLKRHSSVEVFGGLQSPDFAIDIAKLQGESKSAKNRRIKRERDVAESWAKSTGGKVVEENGGS